MNASNQVLNKVDALVQKHRQVNTGSVQKDEIPVLTDIVTNAFAHHAASLASEGVSFDGLQQALVNEVFTEINKTISHRLTSHLGEIVEPALQKFTAEINLNLKDIVQEAISHAINSHIKNVNELAGKR